MQLHIYKKERYSRLFLLFNTFLGPLIYLPHFLCFVFLVPYNIIISFIAFWSILFTGKYPEPLFNMRVKTMQWNLRLTARLYNMAESYPAFGLEGKDRWTRLQIQRQEKYSRLHLLLKTFFAPVYVIIPHAIPLIFMNIANIIFRFLSFWAILFTSRFPEYFFNFITNTQRWAFRVNLYITLMSDTYPPFHGKPLKAELQQ